MMMILTASSKSIKRKNNEVLVGTKLSMSPARPAQKFAATGLGTRLARWQLSALKVLYFNTFKNFIVGKLVNRDTSGS